LSSPSERVLSVSLLWTKEKVRSVELAESAESQPHSDESLMAALKAKDREALAELFRRYSRLVFSVGLRILRDVGEAEEIVQEVFIFLYERAELFDENKGAARAWLVQVAHHRSLDRQEYLHRRNFYSGTDAAFLADTVAGKSDVERELGSKLSREQLKEAFEKLSDRQRLTLELFFFEDLDFPEIAERMNESLENVRHHYYRGIQKLRKDAFVKKLRDKK
jgi:RNA polymerase sigma-70 factor (ECF subfamily)